MKVFVIFLVLFTVSFFAVNHAYGIWLPQSPEELLEESQLIFVGTISSVNELEFEQSSSYITTENGVDKEVIENYTLILDEYTVTVEEFVKNPQDTDTITVRQPTVSTSGKLVPHGGFEIGDRVLFYVESFDGTNTYSKESFLIPKQCDTSSVIHEPKIIGSGYTMMQNGIEKKDNFTANIPIQFIAKSDTGTLSGDSPSIEYDAFISKQVGKIYKERVFHQTITADAKPCEWLSVAEWEFTPDAGNYLLNGYVYKEKSGYSISNTFFSVLPEPPLKQTQSGISFNEIQCKQNLVLIQKYDGSPACVKPETAPKLVTREWGTSDNWIKISNTNTAIYYEIEGAKITSIQAFSEYKNVSLPGETKQTWLKINIESKQNGILQVTLPRNLIDSKIGNTDDGFFVLLDGTETEYNESKTESERILNILFPASTDILEIIGYGYYNSDLEQLDG